MTPYSREDAEHPGATVQAPVQPAPIADAGRYGWLSRVLPPLIALLTLGLTFLYWQSEERNAQTQRDENFQAAADQIAYNLKDRMTTYQVVLRGVKGYFEGSERIDREEFQAYVEALQLRETRPGLRGVSPHFAAARIGPGRAHRRHAAARLSGLHGAACRRTGGVRPHHPHRTPGG